MYTYTEQRTHRGRIMRPICRVAYAVYAYIYGIMSGRRIRSLCVPTRRHDPTPDIMV